MLLAVHEAHNSLDCFSSKDKVLFVMLILAAAFLWKK